MIYIGSRRINTSPHLGTANVVFHGSQPRQCGPFASASEASRRTGLTRQDAKVWCRNLTPEQHQQIKAALENVET